MNFLKNLFKAQKNPTANEKSLVEPVSESLEPPFISINESNELSQEEITSLIDDIARDSFQYNNRNSELIDFDVNDKDALFEDAARLIVSSQSGSTSLLQRRMKLGYNRACRVMSQLESAGIVGASNGSKNRDVLIKTDADLQAYLNTGMFRSPNSNSKINRNSFYDEHKSMIDKRISELQQEANEQKLKNEKEKIRQALLEKERKRNLQKETLNELRNEGLISNQFISEGRREPIPQDVMDSVWNRDSGKCVICGSQEGLEFDHIIPFSKGGATTYRNLQILCKKCNIDKSNKIG